MSSELERCLDGCNVVFDKAAKDSGGRVALLLGWAGSSQRQLSKYGEEYSARGFDVLQVIAPFSDIFIFQGRMEKLARRVHLALKTYGTTVRTRKPARVVIHMFSNGGAFVYERLLHVLKESEPSSYRVCGVAYDSCPGYLYLADGVRAILIALRRSVFAWILAAIFASFVSLHSALSMLIGRPTRAQAFWQTMQSDHLRCPRLFFYSTSDAVISAERLDEFVAHWRNTKSDVLVRKWSDSPHVQHYRIHKREYCSELEAFLAACGLTPQ